MALVRLRAESFAASEATAGTAGAETAVLVSLMLATGLLSFAVSLSKGDRAADRRAEEAEARLPGWHAQAELEAAARREEALRRYARDSAEARRRLVREEAELAARAQIMGLVRDPADAALAAGVLESMEARRAEGQRRGAPASLVESGLELVGGAGYGRRASG